MNLNYNKLFLGLFLATLIVAGCTSSPPTNGTLPGSNTTPAQPTDETNPVVNEPEQEPEVIPIIAEPEFSLAEGAPLTAMSRTELDTFIHVLPRNIPTKIKAINAFSFAELERILSNAETLKSLGFNTVGIFVPFTSTNTSTLDMTLVHNQSLEETQRAYETAFIKSKQAGFAVIAGLQFSVDSSSPLTLFEFHEKARDHIYTVAESAEKYNVEFIAPAVIVEPLIYQLAQKGGYDTAYAEISIDSFYQSITLPGLTSRFTGHKILYAANKHESQFRTYSNYARVVFDLSNQSSEIERSLSRFSDIGNNNKITYAPMRTSGTADAAFYADLFSKLKQDSRAGGFGMDSISALENKELRESLQSFFQEWK